MTAEEIEALRDVARRHGPAPLAYDPIAIELVEAIILVNYGRLRRPPEVWRATAAQIAAVLSNRPRPGRDWKTCGPVCSNLDAPPTANA